MGRKWLHENSAPQKYVWSVKLCCICHCVNVISSVNFGDPPVFRDTRLINVEKKHSKKLKKKMVTIKILNVIYYKFFLLHLLS